MITHQASEPCKVCNSYYRNGDRCNKCGELIIDKRVEFIKKKPLKMKQLWSKSKHRYLAQKEIARGEKGG